MKEKIVLIIILIFVLVDCSSKPVFLRNAPNQIKEERDARGVSKRSGNDFPLDARPGHCYLKSTFPAEYQKVSEQVLVKKATSRKEDVPAIIDVVEEQVVDTEGYTYFKRSDDGLIFCMEEVPPTYKTVKKEVLKSPATTRVVEIPAEYETVTKDVLVKEETVSWEEILCANNATKERLSEIQSKLKASGFNPGRTDGVLDEDTMAALNKYQKAKELKVNRSAYIFMETVNSLGVKVK